MSSEIAKGEESSLKTILIVDEDPVHLRLLGERLKSDDYRIITASHGEQALKIADRMRPDLVLLDVLLPDMNGMDMLSVVKEAHSDLPVVVVTALWDEEEGQRAFDRGAFDYITKPVVMDYLKLAILSALSLGEEKVDPSPVVLEGGNDHSSRLMGGKALEIATFPFRVGRESRRAEVRGQKRYPESVPNNDLYLEDHPPFHLSREHFQIEYRDRQYLVRDRGSSLGLRVNGRPIGGANDEKVQMLQKGENVLVVGGLNSPFCFKLTV